MHSHGYDYFNSVGKHRHPDAISKHRYKNLLTDLRNFHSVGRNFNSDGDHCRSVF